jgi:hypothetical protein
MSREPYLVSEGIIGSQLFLQYPSGTLNPAAWTAPLNRMGVFIWSSNGTSRAWSTDRIPIASVNTGSRQITLADTTNMNIGGTSRFYVEGDLSFLVGPGQWHLDTVGGWLYYWPRVADGPITDQEIVIPTMRSAITLKGSSSSSLIKRITVENIETCYSDFAAKWQANNFTNFPVQKQGHLHIENAEHIVVDRCQVHHTGGHALLGIGHYKYNRVTNTWLHDTGGHGLILWNPSVTDDQVLYNTHRNLRIGLVGQLAGESHCILNIDAGLGLNENLYLHDSARAAISIEGQWTTAQFQRGNIWRLFKAVKCVQSSGDYGSIDVSQMGSPSVPARDFFRQFVIVGVAPEASMHDRVNNGIYCDFDSNSQTFEDGLVTDTPNAPFFAAALEQTQTITNCSFLANGLQNPSFDQTRMAAPYGSAAGVIGLIEADWPFALP